MKKALYITLLCFALPLFSLAQKNQIINGDTIDFGKTKETHYKNSLSCEVELWLASSLTYKYKISKRFSVGATGGLGFVKIIPWNNKKELELVQSNPEGVKIGLVVSYKLIGNLTFDLSPQINAFESYGNDNGANVLAYGIKTGFYFSINKVQLGINVFIGSANIGRIHDNKGDFIFSNGRPVQINKLIIYNSLLIVRFPLKNW